MRRTAQLLAGIALLSGCGSEPVSTEIAANARARATASEAAAVVEPEDVAVLRRVTDPYHSFQKALDAGYSVELNDCLEMPPLGGFPADRVLEVATIIDPTTAESNDLAAASRA
jgi:hypothetical protein